MSNDTVSGSSSLITIVVDLDEEAWGSIEERQLITKGKNEFSGHGRQSREDGKDLVTISQILSSLVIFINALRLVHRENEVCVIAAVADGSARFLLDRNSRSPAKSLTEKIQAICIEMATERSLGNISEIHRRRGMIGALAKALSFSNRVLIQQKRDFGSESLSRILVVSATPDSSGQYVPCVNIAFAAQKQNIQIDVCDFAPEGSKILRQISHLSGGISQQYSGISASQFTQYLLTVFLPDANDRKILKLPARTPISMQAACFCHGDLKARGFVCSVCLSVFCRDPATQGIFKCPTCQCRIQLPGSV